MSYQEVIKGRIKYDMHNLSTHIHTPPSLPSCHSKQQDNEKFCFSFKSGEHRGRVQPSGVVPTGHAVRKWEKSPARTVLEDERHFSCPRKSRRAQTGCRNSWITPIYSEGVNIIPEDTRKMGGGLEKAKDGEGRGVDLCTHCYLPLAFHWRCR